MRIKKMSQIYSSLSKVIGKNGMPNDKDVYSSNAVNDIVKDIYSLEEVKTNKVWINGDPIYRKVITGDMSQTAIPHGINAKLFVNIEGFFYNEDTDNVFNIPSLRVSYPDYQLGLYVNQTNIVLEKATGLTNKDNMKFYITLEYIKQ